MTIDTQATHTQKDLELCAHVLYIEAGTIQGTGYVTKSEK